MKRLILVYGFLFLFCIPIFAQVYVNDVDINKLDIKYLEIVAQQKFLSEKVKITVDYGQSRKGLWKCKIKDKNGKTISFQCVIDALNFMYKNGWEYMDIKSISHEERNVYHYLLKKMKESKEVELEEGETKNKQGKDDKLNI